MTFLIIIILFSLTVSFFCSLCEAVLLSLTPGDIAELHEKHPQIGKVWNEIKSSIDRYIAIILIINTASNTMGATLGGAEFERVWSQKSIIWFSITVTILILIFTEILPKAIGVESRKKLAPWVGHFLYYSVKVLSPLAWIVTIISRPFTKKDINKSITLEELRSLAAYARHSKQIGPYQEQIIHKTSRLTHKTAQDIMIDAPDIVYFEIEAPLEALIVKAHMDPHTRFPICAEHNIDRILGYINFKDLLFLAKNNPQAPSVEGIIRPVKFVPPETPLNQLLKIFIEEHVHLSIVRSSDAKTLGLVTLEDVLEEFIGDIEDEFDNLPKMVHELAGKTWMVGGGILLERLSKILQKPLEEYAGNLSEWLLSKSEKPLRSGDVVTYNDLDFVVRRVRRSKIFEVMILPHGAIPPAYLQRSELK